MLQFPSVLIRDPRNNYACGFSWVAWCDNRLLGLALIGPESTATGASSWILTHPHGRVNFWVEPDFFPATAPASHQEPGIWTLSIDSGPWIRRIGSVTWAPKRRWIQTVLLPANALTPAPDDDMTRFTVVHWGPPAQWTDTVWAFLQHQALPLHPSWQSAFFAHLSASALTIQPAQHWHAPGAPDPLLITVDGLDHLPEYIQQGLAAGWFAIPSGFGPNPTHPLTDIATPDDYLLAWAPALGRQLDQLVQPRIRAGSPMPTAWQALKRQPYPAQGDVIQALSATLRDESSALLIGEQGTGKTLMMSTVPWDLAQHSAHPPAFRVLIVAPDHLVPKWQREVLSTIPRATAHILTRWQDAMTLVRTVKTPSTHPEYWIVGRDRAKLGYPRRFAGIWRSHRGYWSCPDCGQPLVHPDTRVPWPENIAAHTQANHRCPFCHTPLWAADSTLRRMSPIEYLKRYATKRFDLVIIDEVHEAKGHTEQGHTLALASRIGKKLLAGTGTLGSGFADDLHLLQYRLNPASMVQEHLRHDDLAATQKRYGRIKTTTRYQNTADDTQEALYAKRAKVHRIVQRLPGLSPLWFATKLVDRAAFIRLDDLGHNVLPQYQEEVQWITMETDQAAWYHQAITYIRQLAQSALAQNSIRLLGKLLAMSLTVADEPWVPQAILLHLDARDILTPPDSLTEARIYPKEQQICADILQERAAGRKVWVYTTYTQTHPQSERLARILNQAGLHVAVLTSDVPRMKREAWIAQHVAQGTEVILSHPQLVETGLDLLDFPSIFWYSTGYNLFRLRQASRRAWRIGQHAPCLVRFYAYQDTMEETALQWMAQKLEMAQALEGDLNLEGLQRITETEGGGNELARALVHGLPTDCDVTKIWHQTSPGSGISLPMPTTASHHSLTPDPAPSPQPVREPIVLTTRAPQKKRGKTVPANQLAWMF
jgi:hypothetical protein